LEGGEFEKELSDFGSLDVTADEVDTCKLCAAIRLAPRCGKPVNPGLPTRPKICQICIIYVVANCIGNDGM